MIPSNMPRLSAESLLSSTTRTRRRGASVATGFAEPDSAEAVGGQSSTSGSRTTNSLPWSGPGLNAATVPPGRVGVQVHGAGRQPDRQLVAPLLDQRPARLDGVVDDADQVGPLLSHVDLAAADPGDVQQVIDQPRHLLYLAVNDFADPLQL